MGDERPSLFARELNSGRGSMKDFSRPGPGRKRTLVLTCDHPILNMYSKGGELICRPCEAAGLYIEVWDAQCVMCGETVALQQDDPTQFADLRCPRCGSSNIYRTNPDRLRLPASNK